MIEIGTMGVPRESLSGPRESRLQGVVFGFAGMRSLASVPIIRDERLRKFRLVSKIGYGVTSNATMWSVSTSFKFWIGSSIGLIRRRRAV